MEVSNLMRALCLWAGIFFASGVAGSAQDTGKVTLGAIRWDNWRLDSSYGQVLDDPGLRDRIPYYALRLSDGKLGFPGDSETVLDADVHYARSAGLDYFIFGYYLESSAWGRSVINAAALNRALESFLRLPDRLGVKFALNFNLSFPPRDVPAVAEAISRAISNPDYMRGVDGSAPVFFFVGSTDRWVEGLGGEGSAKNALSQIRAQVKTATRQNLYLVALQFDLSRNEPISHRIGFDAASTYATALGAHGRALPYADCAALAEDQWRTEATDSSGGFLPTVTFGWDYRPALRDPGEKVARRPNPDWCRPAKDEEWIKQIRGAVRAAASNPRNSRFPSVVLYAWNENSEGGWLQPTLSEGTRRIKVMADALDRHRAVSAFRLGGPAKAENDSMTMTWPCPPSMDLLVGGNCVPRRN